MLMTTMTDVRSSLVPTSETRCPGVKEYSWILAYFVSVPITHFQERMRRATGSDVPQFLGTAQNPCKWMGSVALSASRLYSKLLQSWRAVCRLQTILHYYNCTQINKLQSEIIKLQVHLCSFLLNLFIYFFLNSNLIYISVDYIT